MRQLLMTLLGAALTVVVGIGIFVGANKILDLAWRRYPVFAAVRGAVIGALLGLVVNSGGWLKGDLAWPAGGALLGALVGLGLAQRRGRTSEEGRHLAERIRPWVFVGPALLFVGVMLVVPAVRTIYLSLHNRTGDRFVGGENFGWAFTNGSIFSLDGAERILTSRLFLVGVVLIGLAAVLTVRARRRYGDLGLALSEPSSSIGLGLGLALVTLAVFTSLRGVIWNNLFWIVAVTALSTAAGLAIAVLADRAKHESLAKSLIFLPTAISFVGASVIWRFVYAFQPAGREQFGLLNAVWTGLGGQPQAWLQQPPWNNLFLIVIMIWIQTGFAMVVLSAAIKAVPAEMLEAAQVDGATETQRFWKITVPSIKTTLGVVITTTIILVLKVYDIVKVMTNGEFNTNVIANEMFDQAFRFSEFGRGATLAVILFVAVLPIMYLNVRRQREEAR